MSHSKIKKFIKTLDKDINVEFVFADKDFWSASIDKENKTIYINKSTFFNCTYLFQKCYILHELGHLYDNSKSTERSLEELFAQIRAIEKAKQMKLYREADALDFIIRHDWSNDNKPKEYQEASKIYNNLY